MYKLYVFFQELETNYNRRAVKEIDSLAHSLADWRTYILGRNIPLIFETYKYQAKSNIKKDVLFINCTCIVKFYFDSNLVRADAR